MTSVSVRPSRSLTIPLSASLLLHVAAAAALLFAKSGKPHAMMQTYHVELIAAPAGPRATGVVAAPKAAPDKPTPARPREPTPKTSIKKTPAVPTPKVTPNTPPVAKPAAKQPELPKAGGGPEGGKGADVAAVNLNGADFPFPVYLQNIVRQIQLNFTWTGSAAFHADVQFFIRRDGTVVDVRVLPANTSASLEFKYAAAGAIEAAGKRHSFGPLPDGFADDVLPVIFSFDHRIIQ